VDDEFVVTIRDRGKPFDPSSVPAPDLHADLGERRVGGLGIYFMRKMMDEVSYSLDAEGGNELTMRKKLAK
jgi:serine/threonine-protein kinase RsbW